MPLCSFSSLFCCAAKQDVESDFNAKQQDKDDENFLESTFNNYSPSDEEKESVIVHQKFAQLYSKQHKRGMQIESFNREEDCLKNFEEVKRYPFFHSKTTAVLDEESGFGIYHTVLKIKTTSKTSVVAASFVEKELERVTDWAQSMFNFSSNLNHSQQRENNSREFDSSTRAANNTVSISNWHTNLGFSIENENLEALEFELVGTQEEDDVNV